VAGVEGAPGAKACLAFGLPFGTSRFVQMPRLSVRQIFEETVIAERRKPPVCSGAFRPLHRLRVLCNLVHWCTHKLGKGLADLSFGPCLGPIIDVARPVPSVKRTP
jgi:hypothetical protein